MKVLAFGEIIWDIYPEEKCIGGAPLNFAAHAALLGNESYLLSAVGDDELAEPAKEALSRFSVKTDFIATVPKKQTGKCIVSLDKRGVPSYNLLEDTAYDYLSADGDFKDFDVFAFGTLIQRSEQNREAIKDILKKNTFKHIFCDLNLRSPFYSKESALLCAENASILKISREELPMATALLLGSEILAPATAARQLSARFPGIKIILITLDSDGALAFQTDEKCSFYAPAKKAKVLSTVGAGDSFSAAFISSYLADEDINKALECAINLSSFVVSKKEAVPLK
ncbi:MAG: carbohydrate kinase [Ruminococcaceae bacterium]|nr:carbohydrate kinase [Oscillospiraceae bacterium]